MNMITINGRRFVAEEDIKGLLRKIEVQKASMEDSAVCPSCGAVNQSEVIDSRLHIKYNGIWRRRRCKCGYRWNTIEVNCDFGCRKG